MKGIKIYLTSPWRIWGDPLLKRDYGGIPFVKTSTEKNPSGHNTILIGGVDIRFDKWIFSAYASHTYQWEVTAKRIQGKLPLSIGFWDFGSSNPSMITDYNHRLSLIKDLENEWGIYRKTVKPAWNTNKACLYFQLPQWGTTFDEGTQWLISDIKVVDLTETGGGNS